VRPRRDLPTLGDLISLTGNTAIVTGAAQGFGAAIAFRLAEAGASVTLADTKEETLAARAAEFADLGHPVVTQVANITDSAQVDALIAAASAATGRIDILVNNAGVFSNFLAEHLPIAEFRRILDVNVGGAFAVSQAVVRVMLAGGRGGSIVNIASVDAFHPSAEGLVHYTTSKHAIAGLTKSLAMELAPHRIRVNAVCPGASMTEGAMELVTTGAPDGIDVAAQWDGIVAHTPLGRLCDPDDVARAALFLASDLAEFVTGSFLVVDGGILVQPLEGYVEGTG